MYCAKSCAAKGFRLAGNQAYKQTNKRTRTHTHTNTHAQTRTELLKRVNYIEIVNNMRTSALSLANYYATAFSAEEGTLSNFVNVFLVHRCAVRVRMFLWKPTHAIIPTTPPLRMQHELLRKCTSKVRRWLAKQYLRNHKWSCGYPRGILYFWKRFFFFFFTCWLANRTDCCCFLVCFGCSGHCCGVSNQKAQAHSIAPP